MFDIETPTKAKLQDVVVLSQKNRNPDDNPGAKLSFELALGNDSLALFDGALKSFLFEKKANQSGQASLDGVDAVSDKPNLTSIGEKVGQLHWEIELTGYTLTIDAGIGGKSNLVIEDCMLDNFRLLPKEGGTVLVRFDLESGNVAEKAFGKLATLKTREMSILLAPPEIEGQADVDDDDKPAAKGRKARGAAAAVH